jgi:hypothetical protein
MIRRGYKLESLRLVTSLYMIVDIQAGKTEFKFLLHLSATQVS